MDNAAMARLLEETADLLEIDGGDSFRIRSYRRHRQKHGRESAGNRRNRFAASAR